MNCQNTPSTKRTNKKNSGTIMYSQLSKGIHFLVIICVLLSSFASPFAVSASAPQENAIKGEQKSEGVHQWKVFEEFYNAIKTTLSLLDVITPENKEPNEHPFLQAAECVADNNESLTVPPESECFLNAGTYPFDEIIVGGRLTLKGNVVDNSGITINANNVTVLQGGIISAEGAGYGSKKGVWGATVYQTGGYHGGEGGNSNTQTFRPYGSYQSPTNLGSGGGEGGMGPQAGGAGGGAIKLVVNGTLTVNGLITADGQSKTNGAAGGGGGSIWIDKPVDGSLTLAGSGTIRANGGSSSSGGGGGGRIAIYYTSIDSLFSAKVQAYGGTGNVAGGPGTIYWGPEDQLVVDNAGKNTLSAGILPDNYDFSSIQLTNGGNLKVMGSGSSIQLFSSNEVTGNGNLIVEGVVETPENFVLSEYRLSAKQGLSTARQVTLSNNAELDLYAEGSPTDDGVFTFDRILVEGDTTLRLFSYDNGDTSYIWPQGGDYGVTLQINQSMTVLEDGTVSAEGMGYGSRKGVWGTTENGAGGYHGGEGGNSNTQTFRPYGSYQSPTNLGSGGGSGGIGPQPGGAGGGAIKLVINGMLTVDGVISADGKSLTTGGSGGGGGSIWIDKPVNGSLTLAGSGTIRANGGTSGSGGGGGGRVAIHYTSKSSFTGVVQAHGGTGYKFYSTNLSGGPGTIYWGGTEDRLIVDNAGEKTLSAGILQDNHDFSFVDLINGGNLTIMGSGSSIRLFSSNQVTGNGNLIAEGVVETPENFVLSEYRLSAKQGLSTARQVTLSNNAELDLYAEGSPTDDGVFTFDRILVEGDTTLRLFSYDNGDTSYIWPQGGDYGVTLQINQSMTVLEDGTVSAEGMGYGSRKGVWGATVYQAGGYHGGEGGNSNTQTFRPYGSFQFPTNLGSGGGQGGIGPQEGGAGGGAIKLVVNGTLTVNGVITADGQSLTNGAAGGGGGSIWIDKPVDGSLILAGSGTIRANGGSSSSGGGGGGRIAIYYTSIDPLLFDKVQAYGGTGNVAGGAGTIYWGPKDQLVVDNAGKNTLSAGILPDNYDFSSIQLTNGGNLTVMGSSSSIQLSSNTITGDGSSALTCEGLVFTDPSFDINGYYLMPKMGLVGSNSLTLKNMGGLELYAITSPSSDGVFKFDSLVVRNGSTLRLFSHNNGDTNYEAPNSGDYGVTLQIAENLSVENDGVISAVGTGYGSGTGPGSATVAGTGAWYGGRGAGGQAPYGSETQPVDLGSGGANLNANARGSAGGGAIKLVVSGTLTNNGTVSADGGGVVYNSGWGGGGSGGSIWIVATALNGTGTIQAKGGNSGTSTNGGNGGGGGRIAVYSQEPIDSNLVFNVSGGTGTSLGNPGTVYQGMISAENSNLEIKQVSLPHGNSWPSDDIEQGTITVTLRDANIEDDGTPNAQPVAHRPVEVAVVSANPVFINSQLVEPDTYVLLGTTNNQGIVTGSIAAHIVGNYEIRARSGQVIVSQPGTFMITLGAVSKEHSSLLVTPSRVAANGTSTAKVTVTVRDIYDNPVSGTLVTLETVPTTAIIDTPSGNTDDTNGIFTANISNSQEGPVEVIAHIASYPDANPLSKGVEFSGVDIQISQKALAETNDGLSSSHATIGTEIEYLITLKNSGAMDSNNEVVIVQIPESFTLLEQDIPTMCSAVENTVRCVLNRVAGNGGTASFKLTATVGVTENGEAISTAYLEVDSSIKSVVTTILDEPTAKLRIVPSSIILETQPDGLVDSISARIVNDGLAPSGELTFELPAHFSNGDWISVTPSTLSSIPVGGSAEITITAVTLSTKAYGQYIGSLKVNSNTILVASSLLSVKVEHPMHSLNFVITNQNGPVENATIKVVSDDLYTRTDGNDTYSYRPIYTGRTDQTGVLVLENVEEGTYKYHITADYHTQLINIPLTVTGGLPQPISQTLTAIPGLYLDPWQAVMSVNTQAQDAYASQVLTVRNVGVASVTGLNVELIPYDDGDPEGSVVLPDWVSLSLPSPLPNLAEDTHLSFAILAKPNFDVTAQVYPVTVRVSDDTGFEIEADINIIVSSSPLRDVIFNVGEVIGGTDQGDEIRPISARGKIILTQSKTETLQVDGQNIPYQPQIIQSLNQPGSQVGEVSFKDLQVGETYTYHVLADNFMVETGTLMVQAPSGAESTPQRQTVNPKPSRFNYTWTVVKGEGDLEYDITIVVNNPDPTFEEEVKEKCLRIDGCFWDKEGDDFSFSSGSGGPIWGAIPGYVSPPKYRMVSLQLSQKLLLSWQQFTASLWLENTSSSALQNLTVDVKVANADGGDVSTDFVMNSYVAGKPTGLPFVELGNVATHETRDQDWRLMPKGTGITTATRFQVYAVIAYTYNGHQESYTTVPEWITVDPTPKLAVKYELPLDGVGCSEFEVAATITNVGAGKAENLRMIGGAPVVVPLDGLPTPDVEITSIKVVNGPNIIEEQLDYFLIYLGDLEPQKQVQVIWHFRSDAPLAFVNAIGILQQNDKANQKIPAIASFEIKRNADKCLATPIYDSFDSDSGDACIISETNKSISTKTGMINTRSGSRDHSSSDISLPTFAESLDFTRWYSTAAVDRINNSLGVGWTHNLDMYLNVPPSGNGIATVKLESTNEYNFFVDEWKFRAFSGFFGTLERHVDGSIITYTLTTCNQTVYTFDEDGKIKTYFDAQGRGLVFDYDSSSGLLKKVHDNGPSQRSIDFSYEGSKLDKIADDSGREVDFVYENGDLLNVYDVMDQKWVYTYENHLLTSVGVEVQTASGPQVRIVERTEYENGKAVRQYNGNNELVVSLDFSKPLQTVITDGEENQTTDQYNRLGAVTGQTASMGSLSSKVYDHSTFRPNVITEAEGVETQLTWVNGGARLGEIVGPDKAITQLDYDDANNLTEYKDPRGNTSTYAYDGALLTSTIDPLKNPTTYEYTTGLDGQPAGLLKRIVGPGGADSATEYHYNAFGLIEWVEQGGQRTLYTYGVTGLEKGLLIKVEDSFGYVTRYCYDAAGRTIRTVSSPSDPGNPCNFELFQPREEDQVSDTYFDALGNTIATVDSDGKITRIFYDKAGRTTEVTRNVSGYNLEDVLTMVEPPVFNPAQPGWNLTSRIYYDKAGNVIATMDEEGKTSRTYYDALNRVVYTVQNLAGQGIEIEDLPPDSLRTSMQNITTRTVYDTLGNVIANIELLPGCTVTEGKDPATGDPTMSVSSACVVSRTYYDVASRPISSVQNWRGANVLDNTPPTPVSSSPDQNMRTDTVYDLAGNAIATINVYPGCTVNRATGSQPAHWVTTSGSCQIDRTYYDALNRPEFTVRNLVGKAVMDEAYDVDGHLTLLDLVRDEEQNLLSQTVYDSAGNMIASAELLPGCSFTAGTLAGKPSYAYNDACLVTRTYYDSLGRATTTVQNLTGQVVSESITTPPVYDAAFPDQNVPGGTPVYDENERDIAYVDPLGRITRTYYNDLQRPVRVIRNLRDPQNPDATLDDLLTLNPLPDYSDADPQRADWNISSQTFYDAEGRVIGTLDAQGNLSRTYYDDLNRAYKTTRNLTDGTSSVETLLGLPEPLPFDPQYPDRNLTTETIYDVHGRAISTVSLAVEGCSLNRGADGSVSASPACTVTRTYYDALGRSFAAVRNLQGQAITDPNLPSNTDANPDNDPTTEANLISHTIYNAAGQAIASIGPDPECEVQRDPDGAVLNIGAACTIDRTYYDGLGRAVTVVRNLVGQSYLLDTPPARETEAQQAPFYQHPDQNVRTDTIFDPTGQQVETIDPNGIITHFGYDAQGRLTDVYENYRSPYIPSADENVHTIYTYDAMSNRLTIQSARSVQQGTQDVTSFTYDKLGRQLTESDPLGHTWRYGYDMLGQRVSQWDAENLETKFVYDDLGRLEQIDYPAPDADVTFTYGPTEQRKTMADGLGTTTWTYDTLGRVTAVNDPFNKTVGYGYDGQNRRTKLIYPDQKEAIYHYNGLNRLQTVTDWHDRQTSYTYEANGQVQLVTLPNGVTSRYDYDALGRLSSLEHKRGETLLSSFTYQYDPSGNRRQAVEVMRQLVAIEGVPDGWTPPAQFGVEEQGYLANTLSWPETGTGGYVLERSTDNGLNWKTIATLPAGTQRYVDDGLARHTQYWYRLTPDDGQGIPLEVAAETGADPVTYPTADQWVEGDLYTTTIDYMYDNLYRLTAADYDDGEFFHYAYDANGNRLSETTSAGTVESVYDAANRLTSVGGVTYTWDSDGNLLNDGTSSYQYDHANRLVAVTGSGETTSFAYNGLGDRLVENDMQFVMDLNTRLTQALSDGTNTYMYGNGRIGQFEEVVSAYFLGDALGSVRQLTDNAGSVRLIKSFQPYGEFLSSLGSEKSAYGFTNEWAENSSKLIHLRARMYSPESSRFIARDTWSGEYVKPMSYNAWLYAYSNPVTYTDPSGLSPISRNTSLSGSSLSYLTPISGQERILNDLTNLSSIFGNIDCAIDPMRDSPASAKALELVIERKYGLILGVTDDNKDKRWRYNDLLVVKKAVETIGFRLAQSVDLRIVGYAIPVIPNELFRQVYNGLKIDRGDPNIEYVPGQGRVWGYCKDLKNWFIAYGPPENWIPQDNRGVGLLLHEFGHIFENRMDEAPYYWMLSNQEVSDLTNLIINREYGTSTSDPFRAEYSGLGVNWRSEFTYHEVWADLFASWALDDFVINDPKLTTGYVSCREGYDCKLRVANDGQKWKNNIVPYMTSIATGLALEWYRSNVYP